jgi:hypothetical protein
MGKKGKKKEEIGTPDVKKFKATREFHLLKECVSIQESLPFVAVDALDSNAFKKVARFLNMVGLLARDLKADVNKDYRFNNHPKYLYPIPQFFPFGFDVDVIRAARLIQDSPVLTYNGHEYQYPEELKAKAEKFLKDVDSYMTKIASSIEPRLKDHFATGLKRFKAELKDDLEFFDKIWTKYEEEYLKARCDILDEVFLPIHKLVTTEIQLTRAEETRDWASKQYHENEFVRLVDEFTNTLFPGELGDGGGELPEDVLPLAESCIFYETKCTEEYLLQSKYLIKDYMELRAYVAKILENRLSPQFKENHQLCRLLLAFHQSVVDAKQALGFVAKLPKLIHAKQNQENWMTIQNLDQDMKHIQKTAHLNMEAVTN